MSAPSDFDVYRRLSEVADEFETLAETASLIGSTALTTAAATVRGMAAAIYEHALNDATSH